VAEGGGEGQATSANTGTPDVFISYASPDSAVADSVCGGLEQAGIRCWVAPRDVMPGEFYGDAIVHAIDAAKVVVLILSQHSAASPHVLREVERASSKRHPVVSLRIDRAHLPAGLEYFLNTSQWLDVSGGETRSAFPKLAEAVQRLITPPSVADTGHVGDAAKSVTTLPLPSPVGNLARRIPSRVVLAIIVLIAATLTYFVVDKFWISKRITTAQPVAAVVRPRLLTTPAASAVSDKSIAVMPFADLSEKHDQEYFADGMAEEIINLLARVPELYVPARTSSFYFKGKSIKIPDIARELGVAHVLEGSVRKSGSRLRLTAQLIRADNGYHLWSQTYDRDIRDVFKVQDEIANAVVQALQISLMGGPLTRQRGGTENLEAYQLYLRAGYALNQNTKVSLEAARRDLEHATKLDPSFGLAWVRLAVDYLVATDYGLLTPQEGYGRTRQLAQQALELSPDLPDAHAIISYVDRAFEWDWPAAEMEWRRALALDPKNAGALRFSGFLYATLGRWNDADRQLRLALAIDPLSPFEYESLGIVLYSAGRYADADVAFRKMLDLAPGFIGGHYYLAKTLLAEGQAQSALAIAQQEANEESRLDILPIVLQAIGRKAEADEAFEALSTKFSGSDAFYVAMVYAYRGDADHALEWLERAYRQKDVGLVEIVGEPLLKNLAADPRYKAFLRKINLPVRDDVAD